MGDFSPSTTSGGGGSTCNAKPGGWFEHKDLGTLFYKTDLNGYSARQFKSSINNIEQATLSDGTKKLFLLCDRGLYYLDDNDSYHRISVPISNLPINIINIEDNCIIDTFGSRYYLNATNGVYVKSIVDNSSNTQANLNYYTSKALCKTFYDERNNEVKCYVTSDGKNANWLYENYEGDRTWNVKLTDNGVTFVFRASTGIVYAIRNDGTLNTVNSTNKTFNNSVNCTYNGSTITGITFISELYIHGNSTTYLFLMTNSGVYYTPKNGDSYNLESFELLNKISTYNDGSWNTSDSTVTNVTCLKQTTSNIVFSSGNSLYCISDSLSYINNGETNFLSIIKNTNFNENGCRNIIIKNNLMFAVTQKHNSTVTAHESDIYRKTIISSTKWYDYDLKDYSSLSATRKKKVPLDWHLASFNTSKDSWSTTAKYRFNVSVPVKDVTEITNHDYSFKLYKLNIQGNSFTSQLLNLSDSYNYNDIVVTTKYQYDSKVPPELQIIKYKKTSGELVVDEQSTVNLSTSNYYITYSSNGIYATVDDNSKGSIFGYYNSNEPLVTVVDGVDKTWSNVVYNGLTQHTSSNRSSIDMNLYYKGKLVRHKNELKTNFFLGFHDTIPYKNGYILASPFGMLQLTSTNNLVDLSEIMIDFTGDTDFREMYELNYKGGDYEGDWFVFTTSDGLLSCRAGDPSNPLWQPDWHIFKYGTSFWKIRCSSSPHRDEETGKKMVEFSNFSVKYPSYIY